MFASVGESVGSEAYEFRPSYISALPRIGRNDETGIFISFSLFTSLISLVMAGTGAKQPAKQTIVFVVASSLQGGGH